MYLEKHPYSYCGERSGAQHVPGCVHLEQPATALAEGAEGQAGEVMYK